MLRFKSFVLPELSFSKAIKKPIPVQVARIDESFEIETLEGVMKAKAGDYLIVGVSGELYACEAAIFHQTYDIVEK